MAVVRAKNPDLTKSERTWLTVQHTSGTTLTVQSSTGWADNNIAVVGNPGEEKTEATDLTAAPPTDLTLTVTALKFTHNLETPVHHSKWDQVEISSQPTGGAFSVLATIDIQWDKLETIYDDTAGLTTDTYRFRFFNSQTATFSAYSDTVLATGYTRSSVGTMVPNIRTKIRDKEGKVFTDAEIINQLANAQDKVEAMGKGTWWFLKTSDNSISTTASTFSYALPSDFNFMEALLFNYVNGNTDVNYRLSHVSDVEMDSMKKDNNANDLDELRWWGFGPPDNSSAKGYFKVHPTPKTASAAFELIYYKQMSTLDSFGDTTEVPDPELLENLAASELERIQGNLDRSVIWEGQAVLNLDLLRSKERRERGQNRFVRFQGQRGYSRLFGDRSVPGIDIDRLHEDYFQY